LRGRFIIRQVMWIGFFSNRAGFVSRKAFRFTREPFLSTVKRYCFLFFFLLFFFLFFFFFFFFFFLFFFFFFFFLEKRVEKQSLSPRMSFAFSTKITVHISYHSFCLLSTGYVRVAFSPILVEKTNHEQNLETAKNPRKSPMVLIQDCSGTVPSS